MGNRMDRRLNHPAYDSAAIRAILHNESRNGRWDAFDLLAFSLSATADNDFECTEVIIRWIDNNPERTVWSK